MFLLPSQIFSAELVSFPLVLGFPGVASNASPRTADATPQPEHWAGFGPLTIKDIHVLILTKFLLIFRSTQGQLCSSIFLQENMDLQRKFEAFLYLFCLSLSSPNYCVAPITAWVLLEETRSTSNTPSHAVPPAPQSQHLLDFCLNENKFFVQTFEARRCLLLPPPAGINIIIQFAPVRN